MAAQLQAAGIEVKMDSRSPIPTAGLPVCMTLREIRSNCGSLKFQTPKARLQSSPRVFLDFISRYDDNPSCNRIRQGLPTIGGVDGDKTRLRGPMLLSHCKPSISAVAGH